jgi:N-acetylglucosamine-6-phosphate deacetylase
MSITVFKNAKIYTPYKVIPKGVVVVEKERIGFVGPAGESTVPPDARVVDAEGKNLCPGFIDIHAHGARGVDFMDADEAGIDKILSYHGGYGTTSLLAATMSASHQKLSSAVERLGRVVGASDGIPEILGIHLEGPYINPEKRGIHDINAIRLPSVDEFRVYLDKSGGAIKIVTLAPEQAGSEDLIAECVQSQVISAVAHSKAGYEIIQKVKSLRHAAHFFNTLPSFHHRQPGVVGAVLDDADFTVELIADGFHLHPAAVRLAYRVKGADKIILVTDASPFCGSEPGEYNDNQAAPVTVSEREITTADGTLAGSDLTMIEAVKNMVDFTGCPLSEAIRMATTNPAELIGADKRKGKLEAGADADLVIFVKRNESLEKADLSKADLSKADLRRANLSSASLQGIDLHEADLSRADLHGADLSEADLEGAYLRGAYLSRADLSEARPVWADLSEANLREANLHKADLSKANLYMADMSGADLSKVKLTEAGLREADLKNADLSGADLKRADLNETDLTGADLSWVNLKETSLFEADLRGARLDGVDLSEAILYKTKFYEKDLDGVKFRQEQRKDMIIEPV